MTADINLLDIGSESGLSQTIGVEIKLIVEIVGKELVNGVITLQSLSELSLTTVTVALFQCKPHALHVRQIL
jgi:hypothetical protein